MENCIFCNIINGSKKADIVFENEDAIVFLPKKMEAYGHCLLVPKRHCENVFDISEEDLCKVMMIVKMMSMMLSKNLGATGVNILHASGKDAGQSVGHFHLHIIPRFSDDGIDAWPKFEEMVVDKTELMKRLKNGG